MQIEIIKNKLLEDIKKSSNPSSVLKSDEIKDLYAQIPKLEPQERGKFGREINELKSQLEKAIEERNQELESATIDSIDITAPWNINEQNTDLMSAEFGSRHPLTVELEKIIDIFARMGFEAIESRQIDDDFHMFISLNFPDGHPARDGYDTFRTEENLIPPAHTSTMQNRIIAERKAKLEQGEPIAAISYGRVFRNEDVDATHEHTFYQCEGVYVSETATLSNMLATLRTFFETYYGQKLSIKTQPGYFPFTEPGLEFLIEKPAAIGGKKGEWLEMMGCGMIHPNVLKMAGIDPTKYTGFAWGGGVDRLVMLKYQIDDVRHFESGKLKFLRKF